MSTSETDLKAWMFPQAVWSQASMMASSVERLAKSAEPTLRAASRAGLEAHGLLNRRMQAWIEVPSKAAKCRTPKDAIDAQMKFWQAAFEQYGDSTKRVAEAWAPVWSALLPLVVTSNGWWSGFGATQPKPERDLITFPEAKEPGQAPQPRPGERRAA
jgi:hypothetical protein